MATGAVLTDDAWLPAPLVLWGVLGAAALLGFLAGVLVWPSWTHNLLGGQIVSGIVPYPKGSLMPAIYGTPYSMLTQAAAVLLRAGVGDWHAALLFSGVQAAVACAALALLTLAFSRSAVVALLVPALMLRFSEILPMWPSHYLAVFHGHLYPNIFPVSPGLYGAIGLFWGMLALAFVALGRNRIAAAMLGFMPGVHIGLAVPFLLATAIVLRIERDRFRGEWRGLLKWLCIGFAPVVATAAWHVSHLPPMPAPTGADDVMRPLMAFINIWDDHTRLLYAGEWLNLFESEVYTFVVGISCLTYLKSRLSASARLVVSIVLVMTALAVAGTILMNIAPGVMPWQVRVALVPRWLNLSSWFFVIASLGLLGRLAVEQRSLAAAAAIGAAVFLATSRLAKAITVSGNFAYLDMFSGGRIPVLLYGAPFPLLIVASACWLTARARETSTPAADGGLERALRVSAVAAIAILWALPFRHATWSGPEGAGSCAGVIAIAKGGNGTLLLGDDLWEAEYIQVRTRRPLLFEPMDVNILPFTPAAAPRAAYILERVYDIDVEEPLPIPLDRAWLDYDIARWQTIGREFGVTDVFAASGRVTTLPVVADDGECALYRIPGAEGGGA